jgi:hypothetical protein
MTGAGTAILDLFSIRACLPEAAGPAKASRMVDTKARFAGL